LGAWVSARFFQVKGKTSILATMVKFVECQSMDIESLEKASSVDENFGHRLQKTSGRAGRLTIHHAKRASRRGLLDVCL